MFVVLWPCVEISADKNSFYDCWSDLCGRVSCGRTSPQGSVSPEFCSNICPGFQRDYSNPLNREVVTLSSLLSWLVCAGFSFRCSNGCLFIVKAQLLTIPWPSALSPPVPCCQPWETRQAPPPQRRPNRCEPPSSQFFRWLLQQRLPACSCR